MSFAWNDYLALAKSLASAGADEASLRTAVSRAYYAAFHEARRYVAAAKPDVDLPRDGRQHDIVWRTLSEGLRQEMAASTHGRKLRQKRTKADYQLTGLRFPSDAQFAITVLNAV